MNYVFKKSFEKQFKKLDPKFRDKFKIKLTKMEEYIDYIKKNELVPELDNHNLKWKMNEYSSISVHHDLRAIYKMQWEEVIFFMIWTHAQLYW